jgi:hypothetical protein
MLWLISSCRRNRKSTHTDGGKLAIDVGRGAVLLFSCMAKPAKLQGRRERPVASKGIRHNVNYGEATPGGAAPYFQDMKFGIIKHYADSRIPRKMGVFAGGSVF